MSAPKPILLALVLCDNIIREAETNKLSLIGTFNGVFSNNFPCTHHTVCVYIAITDARGKMKCKLRMMSLDDNRLLFDIPGQLEVADPTTVAELPFQLQQIKFEKPGAYAIEFWVEDDLLASRKVTATKVDVRPPGA